MCDPIGVVLRLSNDPLYHNLNHHIQVDLLANMDQLINNYPQTYLQVVFQYFRQELAENYNFIEILIPTLFHFGWMPRRFDQLPFQDRMKLLEDSYNVWRGNGFYLRSIEPPTERVGDVALLDAPIRNYFLTIPMQSNIQDDDTFLDTARFDHLYNLLKESVAGYRRLFVDIFTEENAGQSMEQVMEQDEERALERAQVVYYMNISFATTLYRDFCRQVNQVIPAHVANLGHRFQLFNQVAIVDRYIRSFRLNPQDRVRYLRFVLSVLLQCPRLENGAGPGLRQNYCAYLTFLGVYQRGWHWPAVDNGHRESFNFYMEWTVDLNLLQPNWADYLQRLNLLPHLGNLTNGRLVGMLVESMRAFAQAPHDQLTPYDLRNQIIWCVVVAPFLITTQNRQILIG